jgi:hypothetical protein
VRPNCGADLKRKETQTASEKRKTNTATTYYTMVYIIFMSNGTLIFYCDESHPVKHDGYNFYVLGCAYTSSPFCEEIEKNICEIKNRFGYDTAYEIKWSKINGKNIALIKALIEYIKKEDRLSFRVVIVDHKSDNKIHFVLSHEALYNRMYSLLISKVFQSDDCQFFSQARLYIDRRNTHSQENIRSLEEDLEVRTNIKFISSSPVDSKKYPLIQCIDLVLGAISYEKADLNTSNIKLEALSYLRSSFAKPLLEETTPLSEKKMNIFKWGDWYAE